VIHYNVLWVGKRKVYTKHREFYGARRGLQEHGGEVEARRGGLISARGFHGARRGGVEARGFHGARRGLQEHGGEVEFQHGGFTEKGVENTEFLTEEGWKMHSFILYLYASKRRGRLIIIFFFWLGL
jgi:hypothetical protein